MNRYAQKAINAVTRPFSRKVKLYDSGWKNPVRYKKNIVDKTVDRVIRGSTILKNL